MKTTVVNIRFDDYDAYIGRAGKGQSGEFGNPFKDGSREENIARFREYFYERIKTDAEYKTRVEQLRGKRLGCFCKPVCCHGDVYVEYFEPTLTVDEALRKIG